MLGFAMGSARVALVVVGTVWFGHAMIHGSAMAVAGASTLEAGGAFAPICSAINREMVMGRGR
jgi:hypothetical protein